MHVCVCACVTRKGRKEEEEEEPICRCTATDCVLQRDSPSLGTRQRELSLGGWRTYVSFVLSFVPYSTSSSSSSSSSCFVHSPHQQSAACFNRENNNCEKIIVVCAPLLLSHSLVSSIAGVDLLLLLLLLLLPLCLCFSECFNSDDYNNKQLSRRLQPERSTWLNNNLLLASNCLRLLLLLQWDYLFG